MIVQITCAKVGHRQAPFKQKPNREGWAFAFAGNKSVTNASDLSAGENGDIRAGIEPCV
jgi:hypothetical protein